MSGRGNTGIIIGALAATGGAYYLYQAGGNPKVAEKKFEHDAARLSSTVRSELPGKGKEVKTQAKVLGEEAGAKFDSAVGSAKAKADQFDSSLNRYVSDAERKFESTKQEASKDINSAIDRFDRSVEKKAAEAQEQAAKAKSGLSSWFGGK